MSLEDALNKWARSKEGKKKIQTAQNSAAKAGKPFNGKPGGGAPENVDYYADWARRCLATTIEQYSILLYHFLED